MVTRLCDPARPAPCSLAIPRPVNPPSWAQIRRLGNRSRRRPAARPRVLGRAERSRDLALARWNWTKTLPARPRISRGTERRRSTPSTRAAGGPMPRPAVGRALAGAHPALTAAADSTLLRDLGQRVGLSRIWHIRPGNWTQAPEEQSVSLAGSLDTSSHVVNGARPSRSEASCVLVTRPSAIYYLNPDGSYAQFGPSIDASFPGGVFARRWRRNRRESDLLFRLHIPGWTVSGSAIGISAGTNGDLYAVSGSGAIYQTFAGTPTPAPTASPTQSPSPTPTHSPSPTPTASPTPSPAASPSPIPAYTFSGPGHNFHFSGGP